MGGGVGEKLSISQEKEAAAFELKLYKRINTGLALAAAGGAIFGAETEFQSIVSHPEVKESSIEELLFIGGVITPVITLTLVAYLLNRGYKSLKRRIELMPE